jgi:predicted ferric reductase
MWGATLRILLYVAFVLLPVILATLFGGETANIFAALGRHFALMGFAMLILQVVIAARIKWIERAFGFDILIRYHKHMAILAGCLLLAHPLLLAIGGGGWRLLIGLDVPWYIWLGKATLLALLLNVWLSSYQTALKLKWEKWRVVHDLLGPAIITMAFIHSWVVGTALKTAGVQILWVAALVLGVVLFVYHVLLRPQHLKRHPYTVTEVRTEAEDVWTVTMAPPQGVPVYPYIPGQFHFVTFYRNRNLPVEEHHWTISSSPTEKGHVASTIKALGDFTSTIGETKAGDRAAVHGAFGRFSYVLHPEERDLVFVVGGIGITPVMSMLRHMRDTEDDLSVLLLYANKEENQIVFKNELEDMEAGQFPRLKIVHVISNPKESWNGESGLIDEKKIKRYCGKDLSKKVFYVCGPPPMIEAVIGTLKTMGVPDKRIRLEIFSFLD